MKTTKTLLVAVALSAMPAFAFAMGCSGYEHQQQAAISCADGTVWDADKRACVKLTG